ncbi:hypothetical protein Agabi119p4_10165 [Agaricus bisporus var. burnettii]|uniref:F-box domain-containing protein n=1 Tax=Agaricus bisporus var. burnettii TaxID=192524 RepID=A0A8H7C1T1_AGABI|nr:hypothetical protein Agabi119p4_10165 [Agaricus bisporus var. burnettii]
MVPWDLHNTFPTELLSEIFLHFIATSSPESPTSTSSIHHPLLVSHVCLAKAENQASLVRAWMERSGGCPLTIYIFWEDPPFAEMHPALECISRHSARWKEILFYLPFEVFKRFRKIVGKVPLLTDVSIGTGTGAQDIVLHEVSGEEARDNPEEEETDLYDSNESDDDDHSLHDDNTRRRSQELNMFRNAPNLTSVECLNLSPFLFTFPWRNLTCIPLMVVTVEGCLSILRLSPSLQKAGFIFLNTSASPIPANGIGNGTTLTTPSNSSSSTRHDFRCVHHPSLTEFSILTHPGDESIDLAPLFPLLSFPNLLSLSICNLKSHFATSGFTTFLSKLYSLQTLHLRKTALSDQNLVAGLRMVPSVEKLVVHPLQEGMGPPSVTEVVFDELRWKSWVVDGEYSQFGGGVVDEDRHDSAVDENENDEEDGTDENDHVVGADANNSNGSEHSNQNAQKRSNSGLPLLPKLTSIEVKLDNTIADSFIHMIHSRRTSVHFPSRAYRYRKSKLSSRVYDEDGEEVEESLDQEQYQPSGLVAVEVPELPEVLEGDRVEDDIDKPSVLEHVRIRFSEPLHPHFLSEFEDLQRDGLIIEMDYMNENGGIKFISNTEPNLNS